MRERSKWKCRDRLLIIVPILAVIAACSTSGNNQRTLSLPKLPQEPLELRVAHVINPRLPRMNNEQLHMVLAAVHKAAWDHYGLDVRFAPIVEIPVEEMFRKIPEDKRRELAKHLYDFKNGKGNRERLAQEFGKELKRTAESLPEMIEYARPHVGELKENSHEALGAALAKLQLEQLERWRRVPALDGSPAIDSMPYNEFLMWVALGYGDVPYELVLTNQIIASVEDLLPAVHSAVRGGYSNGLTTYGKQSRYGTYSVWSTFAITTDDAWVKQMREGETYGSEEAARLTGIGAAHELGHQLFHFSHPYADSACIMNPVPMFAYRAWANRLSPKECRIGSDPAMQPGASKFIY